MKTLFAAATALSLLASPVAANPLLIIDMSQDRAPRAASQLTLEQQVEIAVEAACEKPFIRNLRGRELHAQCLAEARAEVEALLAARAASPELALR